MGSPWFQIYQRNLQRILFANFIDALEDDRHRRADLMTAGDDTSNGGQSLDSPSCGDWPAVCLTSGIAQGAP
jgi:hypothetical protein